MCEYAQESETVFESAPEEPQDQESENSEASEPDTNSEIIEEEGVIEGEEIIINTPTVPEEVVVEEIELVLNDDLDHTLTNDFSFCSITRDIQNPNYVYNEGVFTDENTSIYREEILRFAQIGIVDGYDDGTFKPLQEMTRTEFLKVALISHCYEYINEDTSTLRYTDVDQSSWQARVIKKAESL